MSCLRIITIFFTLSTYFLVEPANLTYMETAIRDHLSDTRHHDPQYSSYKNRTKEYIYSEFERFELDTVYNTFNETSVSSTVQFHNVIGVLKGTRFGMKNDSILGVGAHYDTVNTTKGVDDNGSGVAAMLEVIRQITDMNKKGTKREYTIIFVSFDLEEYDRHGSKHFGNLWFVQWVQANYENGLPPIQGIIILDTLMEYKTTNNSQRFPGNETRFPKLYESIESNGFRGDFLTLIYRHPTNDTKLAEAFNTAWNISGISQYEIKQFPLPFSSVPKNEMTSYQPFLRSDHVIFWKSNTSAILLTDTADYRGNMTHCYHNPCDNLETLLTDDNIGFLGKTADATAMTVHALSEPTSTPSTTPAPSTTPGNSSGRLSLGISIPTTIIAAVVVWIRNQITFS